MTFSSDKTYSEALQIGDEQKQIMDQVMKIENISEKWDSLEIENKILELLKTQK